MPQSGGMCLVLGLGAAFVKVVPECRHAIYTVITQSTFEFKKSSKKSHVEWLQDSVLEN